MPFKLIFLEKFNGKAGNTSSEKNKGNESQKQWPMKHFFHHNHFGKTGSCPGDCQRHDIPILMPLASSELAIGTIVDARIYRKTPINAVVGTCHNVDIFVSCLKNVVGT
ncbi:MAG: hypothetical protein ACI92E_000413 [Oceanicoccus sp.]|jgi:hypothetical protein